VSITATPGCGASWREGCAGDYVSYTTSVNAILKIYGPRHAPAGTP